MLELGYKDVILCLYNFIFTYKIAGTLQGNNMKEVTAPLLIVYLSLQISLSLPSFPFKYFVVRQLHREFLRAGSNVLQTFSFYASEDKLENRGNYVADKISVSDYFLRNT